MSSFSVSENPRQIIGEDASSGRGQATMREAALFNIYQGERDALTLDMKPGQVLRPETDEQSGGMRGFLFREQIGSSGSFPPGR